MLHRRILLLAWALSLGCAVPSPPCSVAVVAEFGHEYDAQANCVLYRIAPAAKAGVVAVSVVPTSADAAKSRAFAFDVLADDLKTILVHGQSKTVGDSAAGAVLVAP